VNLLFDEGILEVRKTMISFLGRYILYQTPDDFLFLHACWMFISLIPSLLYLDYKRATSMNLTTFFIPNFFFYVFFFRYSPNHFSIYFSKFFLQTIIIGIIFISFSIASSLVLLKIKNLFLNRWRKEANKVELSIQFKCPYCGTEFQSLPRFCYNCSKELKEKVPEHE
ncbi:MAG: hypothetical protein ACTSUN_06775, partial [Promethearchaeota archaeon]